MKLLKWLSVLILALITVLVVLTLHPKTAHHLANNFRNNMIRSFEDSGMHTQLQNVELSFWPLLIEWPKMKITRTTPPNLPNSWQQIFKSVELSECTLTIGPGWFILNAELQCKKIDLHHLPLRWYTVESLNNSFSTDFYFVRSDFRNLESKQGWWNMTVKADHLSLNEQGLQNLHLKYYFTSSTELKIEWPDSQEKMLLINEPEQLRVIQHGTNKSYGFLNPSLHSGIMSLPQVVL